MEETHIIERFETIIRENHKKKTSVLYSNINISRLSTRRPQDVIKIVSSQMKAIQMADSDKKHDRKHRKSKLTEDMLAVCDKALLQKKATKTFETQCVSDTQLIDVVRLAEAFDADRGVSQDLDMSFTVSDLERLSSINNEEKWITEESKRKNTICKGKQEDDGLPSSEIDNIDYIATVKTSLEDFTKDFVVESDNNCATKCFLSFNEADSNADNIDVTETSFKGFTEDFIVKNDNANESSIHIANVCKIDSDFDVFERDGCISLSPILNKREQIKYVNKNSSLKERDKERSVSPVLIIKNAIKAKSPSPLVFNLESFERFEQVAIPLVKENFDLETTKHLINSQLLDRELFLPSKSTKYIALNDCQYPIEYLEQTGTNVGNNDKFEDQEVMASDCDDKPSDIKEKHSSTLEDEILFSSDEENYEQKEIQDLPFTCALETSFYEQSDILDKCMYVGFQTASNKTIQIFTESFSKAKNILNEIEQSGVKKELTLTELVNICDSVSKNGSQCNKDKSIYPAVLNNEEIDKTMENPTFIISTLNKLTGVVTKDSKTVHTIDNFKESNDSNTEVENIEFPDIDMSKLNAIISNVSQEIEQDNCTHQKPNENVLKPILNIEAYRKGNYQGFTTANNKIIKLSDAALTKCQKVFQDIDLNENYEGNNERVATNKYIETSNKPKKHIEDRNPNKDSNNIDKYEIHTDINDEIILREFENIEMSVVDDKGTTQENPVFEEFKAASHKNIKKSNEVVEKAKHLFEDIDMNLSDSDHLKQNVPNIMTTNSNNMIKNYKNIVEGQETTSSKAKIGFKTASNKIINISDQALARTKNLFHEIELGDVQIGELKEKEYITSKLNFEEFNQPSTGTGFTGFHTTNKKKIAISDKDMLKSKSIFKDIDHSTKQSTIDYQGFKTDNNKQAKISVKPMLMSKKIVNDIPELNDLNVNKKSCSNVVGFQTASNKPVHISTKGLEKSKKTFEKEILESNNDLNVEIPKKVTPVPNRVGFLTANDKPVQISAKALERSKIIFQDLDSVEFEHKLNAELKNEPAFGFKTASNKEVKISEQALAKTKQIFNYFDFNVINDNHCRNDSYKSTQYLFEGFKTNSNKNEKVSKETLNTSKKIFLNIDVENFDGQVISLKKDNVKESKETVCGFKTANNNPVLVSSDAVVRSKRLFEDIDAQNTNTFGSNACIQNAKTKGGDFGGFKTATNKKVSISKQALAKSKQIFQDIDVISEPKDETDRNQNIDKRQDQLANIDCKSLAKMVKTSNDLRNDSVEIVKEISTDNPDKENIDNIINTQVMNNFEETLYTEDFRHEITQRNKRSGSPILSCPKAKRRRFETPFKTDHVKTDIINILNPVKQKESGIFTENYKKEKIYRLNDLSLEENDKNSIDPYITNFDFDILLNFEFSDKRNDLTENKMDVNSLKELFLSSVNAKLVPNGWLDNHIRLIIWKLISYEVRFPKRLGLVCTARNVINQLKYRYDKELYNAERPALRKILEKDDVPSKTIVLCVAAVFVEGVRFDSVATTANNVELLLTDGWYCVMAAIDKMLARLVRDNRIVVGSKLVTNGAELLNCEQGVAPWEDSSSVRLKIFGNSTRRARWDARLGYHGNGAMLSRLSNVKLDGGKVSKLRVFVARVYPQLYVEKFEDGSTVTRSERLEHLYQIKHESERQALLERLYEEVEREFSDHDSQDSEGTCDSDIRKTCLQSGSQIFEAVRKSKDPSDLKNHLTSSQTNLLEAHTNKRREKLLEKVQARIMDKMEKNGLKHGRNVVTVLKIRVAGVEETNGGMVVTKGLLSIWKPNDALLELIKEDSWIEVLNVVPTAFRNSEIQLSAGRQSAFIQSKYKGSEKIQPHINTLKRVCYPIKELNKPINTDYNEVDTAGIIFLKEPSGHDFDTKSQFQNVYLADRDCGIICVNFWGGLQKFGFQNILDTGQIVACINLQKRAGNTRNMPQYRATEFSYFTKTPKSRQAREIIDDLSKMTVLDRRRICEECVKLKNSFSVKVSNENITPYRVNNIDLSKSKVFLDSVERIVTSEFNLIGLDFESSFKHKDVEELSPRTLKRKREVNNRINKLKMYGEPPPLNPIHIKNKSKNALSSYKSPLANNDVSPSAARAKKMVDICRNTGNYTPLTTSKNLIDNELNINVASGKNVFEGTKENKLSPVTSRYKTYVESSVHPVKLNFENNVSDLMNTFPEEFDASPPLSLD